jgi:hypothetical protein
MSSRGPLRVGFTNTLLRRKTRNALLPEILESLVRCHPIGVASDDPPSTLPECRCRLRCVENIRQARRGTASSLAQASLDERSSTLMHNSAKVRCILFSRVTDQDTSDILRKFACSTTLSAPPAPKAPASSGPQTRAEDQHIATIEQKYRRSKARMNRHLPCPRQYPLPTLRQQGNGHRLVDHTCIGWDARIHSPNTVTVSTNTAQ